MGWGWGARAPSLLPASLRSHPWAAAVLVALTVLVLAPIASLIRIALGGDAELWGHLVAYVLPVALFDTVLLLIGVAAIAAVVGVGTAWLITAYEFPGRGALVWLLPLPLAIPTYIVAYVYADALDAPLRMLPGSPAIRSLGGAVFVMGFVLYPYVHLAARAMFQTESAALIEAARSLGASRWRLMRDISVPLARPAIAAGLSLVLLEALNDIGASEYLGVQTLTLSIFTTWLNRGNLPGAAQIACVTLLAIGMLLALERAGRRRKGFAGHDRHPRSSPRVALDGASRWIAAALCLAPVAIGFLFPLAYLARQAIRRALWSGLDPDLARHLVSTLTIAAAATVVTLMLGFAAVFALRLLRHAGAAACVSIASLGYAVPGTVLALGLLAPLVAIDEVLNALARAATGHGVGLVLAGSSAAVVIAYAIRFLAIPIGLAGAGLARISPDLDDAARMSGARPARLVRSIHLPLARSAMAGAALLVFVDCLKELPATLLLRPLNVETLATYLYQYATRGSFEDGAAAALLIVLAGILPVIRMVRLADDAMLVPVSGETETPVERTQSP